MIFSDIESYLEFIAGWRDITGNQTVWFLPTPSIQLASYDVGIVQSVAEQTLMKNIGLSIKQAALAENLIKKYEKQLKKLTVNQPDHRNYRYPLREVTHVSKLSLEDNLLHFRFPFDNAKITDIKNFANKDAQGRVFWEKEKKAWVFSLTEFNVNWVVAYAHSYHIPVSDEAQELLDLIVEVEKIPYKIELNINDKNQFYIENAPESMNEYIAQNIGFDNIYSLVDNSGALNYTVNKEIQDAMITEHGDAFMELCSSRSIDFVPNKIKNYSIFEIIEWAIAVNRLPICVYNPNFLTPELTEYQKYFNPDEIEVISMKSAETGQTTINIDPKIKLVYTNKVLSKWGGRMPLLITYANLMHGVSKKEFLNRAEKIVYFCEILPKR